MHNGENESINDSFHDFHFQFDGKKEIICEKLIPMQKPFNIIYIWNSFVPLIIHLLLDARKTFAVWQFQARIQSFVGLSFR